ncbi:hypothetical protein K443DRAFT_11721 [Laccaria amethystina LaAM-08-1]|uniref:Unplaced genomic scaffold K443scaffold_238, whole genome shotgun sequence n=1 Tax=Laccaria amethystina LaAM-08-1 TaxID=1095629 RepID=A0A0C9XFM7_9AGAR|nr:hypothetical protein K443DRAFT_11721 [Laccaria amethystina LaAM-08-1]
MVNECLACHWFYSFGEGVVPNATTPDTLPPPPTLPPLAVPSSQPSSTFLSTGEQLSKLCVHAPNCKQLANNGRPPPSLTNGLSQGVGSSLPQQAVSSCVVEWPSSPDERSPPTLDEQPPLNEWPRLDEQPPPSLDRQSPPVC